IPQFLFSDSATIIVSLLADPRNERGFGRGEVNATTPFRVLCLQNYREEPSINPKTPETIVSCGPVDHIMYVVNSQGKTTCCFFHSNYTCISLIKMRHAVASLI
ncbi:hypothetical protein AVEN_231698-1, partial [Araneus ventricosus]